MSRSVSGCGSAPTSAPSDSRRPTSSCRRPTRRLHRLTVLQMQRARGAAPRSPPPCQDRRVTPAGVRLCGDALARCPFAKGGGGHRGPAGPDRRRGDLPAPRRSCWPPSTSSPGSHEKARPPPCSATSAGAAVGMATSTPTTPAATIPPTTPPQAAIRRPRCAGGRLRPPDLIIQDELHLITGALGTSVGLFEVAVDTLSPGRPDGSPFGPSIVASTATVRNAENQVRGLYGRRSRCSRPRCSTSPTPTSLRSPDRPRQTPGRRYFGVCAHGIRLTTQRSGSPRCCCRQASCCSTRPARPPTPT